MAHLGWIEGFLPKMEHRIGNLKNKAFIGDGVKWIWNWAANTYPDCLQIVVFFHAKEHQCDFAKAYYKDTGQRED